MLLPELPFPTYHMAASLQMLVAQSAMPAHMPLSLRELIADLPVLQVQGNLDLPVQTLSADSRRVGPEALFFAMPGLQSDGNQYVEEAISRGAHAVVSQQPARHLPAHVTWVQVADIREAVAAVAQRFYQSAEKALEIVGVTGTNGKTTVTTLLRWLLQNEQDPVGLLGTVNYILGRRTLPAYRTTPLPLELFSMFSQMRDAGCRRVLMEVSSHGIDQKRVHRVPYRVAVFLNLTQDHLDYHGDMETYYQAKRKLFTGELGQAPEVAVINVDDPYGRRLVGEVAPGTRVIRFSMKEEAELRAVNVALKPDAVHFDLVAGQQMHAVRSGLLGHYNVSNILAALGVCMALGESLERAVERIRTFSGVPGRMERIELGQDFRVLVDYAHTDDALRNALAMLKQITPGRILLVFGCGGDRDRGKRPLMMRVALTHADIVYATSDNPRSEPVTQIFDDMRQAVTAQSSARFVEDRRRAIGMAINQAQPGDTVLIAGKGHEAFQEFANTVMPFDDRAIARELLQLRLARAERSADSEHA